MERFKLAVSNGDPVNPPIWWIAPNDEIAQTIGDEFMLGEKILAAPVIEQGKRFLAGKISLTKENFFLQEKHLATFTFLLVIGRTETTAIFTTHKREDGFAATERRWTFCHTLSEINSHPSCM